MSNVESFQLVQPELLSEESLCAVLKSSCIEIPKFKKLNKSDLIEIFNRVALPLPQRQYDETRNLGKKMSTIRKVRKISISSNENEEIERLVAQKLIYESEHKNRECYQNGKLTNSSTGNDSVSPRKETSLSPTSRNSSQNLIKRKCDEKESPSDAKKRQKITWP